MISSISSSGVNKVTLRKGTSRRFWEREGINVRREMNREIVNSSVDGSDHLAISGGLQRARRMVTFVDLKNPLMLNHPLKRPLPIVL
jgi:hypothetical protein